MEHSSSLDRIRTPPRHNGTSQRRNPEEGTKQNGTAIVSDRHASYLGTLSSAHCRRVGKSPKERTRGVRSTSITPAAKGAEARDYPGSICELGGLPIGTVRTVRPHSAGGTPAGHHCPVGNFPPSHVPGWIARNWSERSPSIRSIPLCNSQVTLTEKVQ